MAKKTCYVEEDMHVFATTDELSPAKQKCPFADRRVLRTETLEGLSNPQTIWTYIMMHFPCRFD